jgi:hypothetical protein
MGYTDTKDSEGNIVSSATANMIAAHGGTGLSAENIQKKIDEGWLSGDSLSSQAYNTLATVSANTGLNLSSSSSAMTNAENTSAERSNYDVGAAVTSGQAIYTQLLSKLAEKEAIY